MPGAGQVGASLAASLGGMANTGQGPVGRRNSAASWAQGCSRGPCYSWQHRAAAATFPPPFPPVLDAALHVGLITLREMKLFLLNVAQFDSWSQGSFPTVGSLHLLEGPVGGWKHSALTSTLMYGRCDYSNAARLLLCHYALLPMGFLIQSVFLWVQTPMSPTVGRDRHLQLFPACKCYDLLCKSEFPCSSPSLLVPSVFIGIIKQIFASDLLKANLRFFCLQSSGNEGGMSAISGSGQQPGGIPWELSLCRGWWVSAQQAPGGAHK